MSEESDTQLRPRLSVSLGDASRQVRQCEMRPERRGLAGSMRRLSTGHCSLPDEDRALDAPRENSASDAVLTVSEILPSNTAVAGQRAAYLGVLSLDRAEFS